MNVVNSLDLRDPGTVLAPEKIGNININTGTTLLLKTVVN